MAKNRAGLWDMAARLLAAEDSRFVGLSLKLRGKTTIEVHGPPDAVGILLGNTVNFRPALRQFFRQAAEEMGGWDTNLEADDDWPLFSLKPAPDGGHGSSGLEGEVGQPAEAIRSPMDPRWTSPGLRAVDDRELAQSDRFKRIGNEMGELVAQKNLAYGNAFNTAGNALRLLYPRGISPDQYDDALALVRIWDKLQRIATDRDAMGESPYRDVAGYGILGTERVERNQGE